MKFYNLYEAFLLKLRFNLKAEASKHYLNYAWWLIEPVLHVTVFYFVFDVLLRRGAEGFVVFLLCGQIPFLWFSRSVSNASSSIVMGRGLIQQMAIPKPFFPMLVVAQDMVKQSVVFLCLLLFVLGMGYGPHPSLLALPVMIAAQILLVCACALIAAAITPFLPDFKFLVGTGMTMLLFASGIFYDYDQVLLEAHKTYFLFNPIASLIEGYRDVLMRGVWPNWQNLLWIAGGSALAIHMMLKFYRRNDAVYARLVIQ